MGKKVNFIIPTIYQYNIEYVNPVYLLLGVFCDVFRWRRLWFLLL